nr:MAG TPA: hypothetical protein [Bacteriophage sp.]
MQVCTFVCTRFRSRLRMDDTKSARNYYHFMSQRQGINWW